MKKKILIIAIMASAFAVAGASAEAANITRTYHATIDAASGTHAGAIQVGDPITVSYTVDDSIPDSLPGDPANGLYMYSVRSLSVSIPAIGFSASGQSGTSQTAFSGTTPGWFDDVSFYTYRGGITSGTLEGSPVEQAVIEFQDSDRADPRMITSDAFATGQLIGHEWRYVQLHTADGGFTLLFLSAAPTVAELVSDGTTTLQGLVNSGAIKSGVGVALTSKLNDILAAFTAGNTSGACLAWKGFRDQVKNLPPKQITAGAQAQLNALAESLRVQLGGCQ